MNVFRATQSHSLGPSCFATASKTPLTESKPPFLGPTTEERLRRQSTPLDQLSANTTYQIKPGDTLSAIAAAHGISVEELAQANNISNPNRIYAGDTITIPQPSVSSLLEAVPSAIRRANPEVAAHIKVITAMAEKHGLSADQTAYVLATATHESNLGANMEEFASGRDYEGRADLGNTQPGDGVRFKGRGYVQITGRANYQDWSNRLGIDLVSNSELAERPEIAAEILVLGMKEGTFTGRGLDSYINDSAVDFRNARRIVNGMDKADLIAGYASHYQQALATSPPQATLKPVQAAKSL